MSDPFDIFPDEEETPAKRNPNMLWNKISENTNSKLKDLVPEIDTKVVDLPKENENEKEMIINYNDENGVEPPSEPMGVPAPYEEGVGEEPPVAETTEEPDTETQENEGYETFDDEGNIGGNVEAPEMVEEDTEEPVDDEEKRNKIMKEMQALAQDPLEGFMYSDEMEKWTPKQKQDAIKAWLGKQPKEEPVEEEPIEEEEPVPEMTDEEALAEARMLAQDKLKGFNISGKDWAKLSTEEKLQVIENYKDAGDEIHNEFNKYDSYKHYPTALRVAEDVQQGVENIADRTHDLTKQNLAGGESINRDVNRSSIPHYDYRSFFK